MSESDHKSDEENSRIILHEGYLSKKGQINRSWKKRYFILFSDKKLAYYSSKELTHLQPINELNLSTVKELSLLQFSNNPAKKSRSRTKSFTDIFLKKDTTNNTETKDNSNNTLSSNYDSSDNDEMDNKTENNNEEVYVDAPINTRSMCNKRHAFDIMTEKRSYWLHCDNVTQLNEWIIYLKYAIFGKLILNGYLTIKSKSKLKIKWKLRFIEVYQSKIIRIYKNNKKTKVKQQIDIDENNVSIIKYGNDIIDNNNNDKIMKNIIEIYNCNENLIYIFSAENKQIRNEFMDSFYLTMNAYKINILCEGYLHFRAEDAKCWKKSYFALISGALIRFKSELLCLEFKNSIYSNDNYFNKAFNKYIIKSMPMIDVKIEKKSLNEIDNKNEYKYSATTQLLESLKIFTVETTVGKWYFGAEEATEFLFWCQSFHTFCKNNKNKTNNKLFSDKDIICKAPNIEYNEKEIEHSESKKAHSAEPRFIMDIHEDLVAINDGSEYDESKSNNNNNTLSGNILMAVNLDKRAQKMREFNSNNNNGMSTHFIGSQSLSLKPFTKQELMNVNNNNMKNELKHEYVYSSDDETSETDKDCLETTIYDNSEHNVLKKHSMADFIVDDEY